MPLILNRINTLLPHLPRAHYKEYLVSLINAHSLDPATLYEVEELETATIRYLHLAPQPMDGEDLPAYQARLLQVVLSRPAFPLPFQKSPVTVCFSTAGFQYHYPLSFAEAERRGTLGTEYCPQKKIAEGRVLMGLADPALTSSSSTNKEASYGLGFLVVLLPGLSI